MVTDRPHVHPVQLGHPLLRHPERVAVENYLDAGFSLACLIQQNVRNFAILYGFDGRIVLREIS
jgi:hypothetical protein